jgi:ketosteroid isomerase-like protein
MKFAVARPLLVLYAALSPLCAAAAQSAPTPLDEVIAAERAFAVDTGRRGFKQGFLGAVAGDGIVFAPGPVNARARLEALPDAPPPGPPLDWWPEWAGVSTSGDLGFTSGGASIPVRYFTVWQRQTDGTWRWIYDGGPGLAAPMVRHPDVPVARVAPATAASGSAARALAEIAPLEVDLAARAATDAPAAYLRYLAPDSLVAGSETEVRPGQEQAAELARRPAVARLRAIGAVASRAGDLAFTYGEVRWERDGAARWGHYARIWRNGIEGWRIVADVLIPAPGAPPAPE